MNDYENRVIAAATKQLVGRTITAVRYLLPSEAEDHGWDQRGVVIILDDGSYMYPSCDDEGNGPGAMFTSFEGELEVMAVI